MTKPILKLFGHSGGDIIHVFFLTPAPIPNSKRNLISGAQNTQGWEFFFAIFDWNRSLSRKWCGI